MTAILGISAFYHDSAAALVVDGEVVAAAQEERFTRRKHDHAFPVRAIRYCLDEAGIESGEIFAVLNHGRYSSDYENPGGYLEQYQNWNRRAERAAQDLAGFMAYNHELEIPRQIQDEFTQVNRLDEHPAANLNRVFGRKLYRKILDVAGNQ